MAQLFIKYFKHLAPFLALTLLISSAYADIGPKPTAKVIVKYNGMPIIGTFEAKMLSCVDPKQNTDVDCYRSIDSKCRFDPNIPDNKTDIKNVLIKDTKSYCYWKNDAMAWGGDCAASKCDFNYFLPNYFKLAVKLPLNKEIFVTNAITRVNFDSTYEVNLKSIGESTIKDTTSIFYKNKLAQIFFAMFLTILIEWLFSLVFFKKTTFKPLFIVALLIGNVITVPIVWGFSQLPIYGKYSLILLTVTEFIAFCIESIVYTIFYRKQVRVMRLYLFTILANLLSYFLGLFISF